MVLMLAAGAGVDICGGGASGSAGTRGIYSGPIWPQALKAAVAAKTLQIRMARGK
jgi:hypothetical protein